MCTAIYADMLSVGANRCPECGAEIRVTLRNIFGAWGFESDTPHTIKTLPGTGGAGRNITILAVHPHADARKSSGKFMTAADFAAEPREYHRD